MASRWGMAAVVLVACLLACSSPSDKEEACAEDVALLEKIRSLLKHLQAPSSE